MLQAYALCAAVDLEVELVPEEAIDLSRYRLVLAPSTQKLLSPTWQALQDWVQRGNTLYWSYHAGDSGVLHGAWCHMIDNLTGCRHQLRYGCLDLPQDPFVLQGAGLDLRVPAAGTPCGRSRLPLQPVTAQVLARDGNGAPALTSAGHGAGRVLFLNHPLERYMAEQPEVTARCGAHRLYRLLAREAGLTPGIHADEPQVQVRTVRIKDGPPLVWIFNHGWDPVDAHLDAPQAAPLFGTPNALVDGSQVVELEPKQVGVWQAKG